MRSWGMALELRAAATPDFPRLARIAADGGSPDAESADVGAYFGFVLATGRLVVAVDGGEVVGLAGAVPADVATMVTDLFVDPSARVAGVGGALLEAVLSGAAAATTFSSRHPAALRLYEREGLSARARLLTMAGQAVGGGAPLRPAPWRHGRHELVAHFAACGATVCADAVVRVVDGSVEVQRVAGDHPEETLAAVLAAAPAGTAVTLSLLETDPIVSWLTSRGFAVIDDDVWCATPNVDSLGARCVHRGLC